MHRKTVNIIGQRFGKLTVCSLSVFREEKAPRKPYWNCDCDCGGHAVVRGTRLKEGVTRSCGCLKRKAFDRGATKVRSRAERIWSGMRQRCLNPNNRDYTRYGGRGITVCAAWASFKGFYRDMGDPPPGTSLDRKKNHLGYSKKNCRWATHKQQCNNRRNKGTRV